MPAVYGDIGDHFRPPWHRRCDGRCVATFYHRPVSLIVCHGVEIAFGATTVLSGLDLRIEPRDRLAVVGANGAGKSSLLDVLAGISQPVGGAVERDRRLRIGYLPQEAPPPTEPTVLAEAMASRSDRASR